MSGEVLRLQIVLREYAGLGNQLFRYAALRYYAKRYGAEMRISVDPARFAHSHGYPRPFLLSHFSITVPIRERSLGDRLFLTGKAWLKAAVAPMKWVLRIDVFTQHHSSCYSFVRDLPLKRHLRRLYLVGRWQTYTIVDEVAEELRAELTLKEPPRGKNLEVLEQIKQCSNPVSLHIRRGDCLVASTNRVDLGLDYYLKAITIIKQRLDNPTFFVFSDDIPFTKKYLPQDVAMVFVEHNDDFNAHEDLRLMSSCYHHIVANSTFSWWGAWLNPRSDKICIAPRHWYRTEDICSSGLLPQSWIVVDAMADTGQLFAEFVPQETFLS